jgi:hypothetical protein
MSASTLQTLTGLVLLVHGIGHVMALLPAFNISSSETWHYRSWLLTRIVGDKVSRFLVIVLYGAAMIGFIAAGLGVFNLIVPHSLWQTLAVYSAVISFAALALFWNAFVAFMPNKFGAIVVDAVILWALLSSGAYPELIQSF